MTHVIISYIYFSILALSALSSMLVHFQNNLPSYLKYFTPFILLTLGIEILGTRIHQAGHNNIPLYNCFTLFEFVFYFCILYRIISNRLVRKIIRTIFFLYPAITLTNIIFFQGIGSFHTYTFLLGAFLIVSICAFYFQELIKMPVFPNPWREPDFWIVCGLFVYYSGSLPLMAAAYLMNNFSMDMLRLMAILLMSLNYVLYSLFAVAFLCNIKSKKPDPNPNSK